MTRALALLAVATATAGCASLSTLSRDDVIRHIVSATVQLRIDRPGGERASGSGVVVAADQAGQRSWVVTAAHVIGSGPPPQISVAPGGRGRRLRGEVIAVSEHDDLAVIEVRGAVLPSVRVRHAVHLGEDVWVAGFPWGRRLTLVSGVVSQLGLDEEDAAVEGPARMVDATVTYGVSGGGVFDATGALVAIVEGYRTARITLRNTTEPAFDMPVAGETTLVSGPAISRFVEACRLRERPLPR